MTLKVELVSYTGNGTSQSIATSFIPRVIIIKARGAINSVIKTDTMAGDATAFFAGASANFAGGVTAVPSGNSFAVGADAKVNTNGTVFDALCLGGDTSELGTGTFTGNNGADRAISAGLTPVLTYNKRDGTTGGHFRVSGHPTDTCSLLSAAQVVTNAIRNFSGTDFTVSSGANASGQNYHWFSVPADVNLFIIAFTGNASNPRNITGAGFTPDFALVKANDTNQGGIRTVDSGNTYQIMNFGTLANAIDALISDGITVNSTFNASAVDHYGWALKEHLADAVAGQPMSLRATHVPGMRAWQPRVFKGKEHGNNRLTTRTQEKRGLPRRLPNLRRRWRSGDGGGQSGQRGEQGSGHVHRLYQ